MVAQTCEFKCIPDQGREVHSLPVLPVAPMAHLAGFQHLLDGAKEPIGVIEHNAIKVATLGFVELPAFESLQVQANGSDGRLKCVRDSIEKAVLLLISADFAHEKNGVDH